MDPKLLSKVMQVNMTRQVFMAQADLMAYQMQVKKAPKYLTVTAENYVQAYTAFIQAMTDLAKVSGLPVGGLARIKYGTTVVEDSPVADLVNTLTHRAQQAEDLGNSELKSELDCAVKLLAEKFNLTSI